MEETAVVTCFLRHEGEVLLLRRSSAVGSSAGQWGGVAGHADGDPNVAARREIAEETGLQRNITFIRRGEPFTVPDEQFGTLWRVHPFLFEAATRAIETNWETSEYEWVHPTEILRRETVPNLWQSYDRVRPDVETIATDSDHGSAWLSIRALEVLRDEAGILAWGDRQGDWAAMTETARDLRDVRPSMPVIANRVNRVMARAPSRADGVEPVARSVLESSREADREAATVAGDRLPEQVATLSRSGTVRATVDHSMPDSVLIAESRPGSEGRAVAEELADECAVTLTSGAGFPWAIHDWGADVVVVGADAIYPGGVSATRSGREARHLQPPTRVLTVLSWRPQTKSVPTGISTYRRPIPVSYTTATQGSRFSHRYST